MAEGKKILSSGLKASNIAKIVNNIINDDDDKTNIDIKIPTEEETDTKRTLEDVAKDIDNTTLNTDLTVSTATGNPKKNLRTNIPEAPELIDIPDILVTNTNTLGAVNPLGQDLYSLEDEAFQLGLPEQQKPTLSSSLLTQEGYKGKAPYNVFEHYYETKLGEGEADTQENIEKFSKEADELYEQIESAPGVLKGIYARATTDDEEDEASRYMSYILSSNKDKPKTRQESDNFLGERDWDFFRNIFSDKDTGTRWNIDGIDMSYDEFVKELDKYNGEDGLDIEKLKDHSFGYTYRNTFDVGIYDELKDDIETYGVENFKLLNKTLSDEDKKAIGEGTLKIFDQYLGEDDALDYAFSKGMTLDDVKNVYDIHKNISDEQKKILKTEETEKAKAKLDLDYFDKNVDKKENLLKYGNKGFLDTYEKYGLKEDIIKEKGEMAYNVLQQRNAQIINDYAVSWGEGINELNNMLTQGRTGKLNMSSETLEKTQEKLDWLYDELGNCLTRVGEINALKSKYGSDVEVMKQLGSTDVNRYSGVKGIPQYVLGDIQNRFLEKFYPDSTLGYLRNIADGEDITNNFKNMIKLVEADVYADIDNRKQDDFGWYMKTSFDSMIGVADVVLTPVQMIGDLIVQGGEGFGGTIAATFGVDAGGFFGGVTDIENFEGDYEYSSAGGQSIHAILNVVPELTEAYLGMKGMGKVEEVLSSASTTLGTAGTRFVLKSLGKGGKDIDKKALAITKFVEKTTSVVRRPIVEILEDVAMFNEMDTNTRIGMEQDFSLYGGLISGMLFNSDRLGVFKKIRKSIGKNGSNVTDTNYDVLMHYINNPDEFGKFIDATAGSKVIGLLNAREYNELVEDTIDATKELVNKINKYKTDAIRQGDPKPYIMEKAFTAKALSTLITGGNDLDSTVMFNELRSAILDDRYGLPDVVKRMLDTPGGTTINGEVSKLFTKGDALLLHTQDIPKNIRKLDEDFSYTKRYTKKDLVKMRDNITDDMGNADVYRNILSDGNIDAFFTKDDKGRYFLNQNGLNALNVKVNNINPELYGTIFKDTTSLVEKLREINKTYTDGGQGVELVPGGIIDKIERTKGYDNLSEYLQAYVC